MDVKDDSVELEQEVHLLHSLLGGPMRACDILQVDQHQTLKGPQTHHLGIVYPPDLLSLQELSEGGGPVGRGGLVNVLVKGKTSCVPVHPMNLDQQLVPCSLKNSFLLIL